MDTFSYNLDIVNEFLRDRKPTEIISATLFCVASLILTIKYLVQIITNDRWKVHIFRGLTSLPLVREIKFKQIQKAELEIFKSVHGKTENLGYRCRLPSKSYSKVSHPSSIVSFYGRFRRTSWKKRYPINLNGQFPGRMEPCPAQSIPLTKTWAISSLRLILFCC